MSDTGRSRPVIGLALGSGSARGWSHIGVIRVLERAGIAPAVVCGTSIGALVGAAYAAGQLERLEGWVRDLTWHSVLKLIDLTIDGGLIKGGRIINLFRSHFEDIEIDALALAFGAVATELETGREVWLRHGSVVDAVRASFALPGLFTPAPGDGRLLVDGGLVNPVPVSLCRAMGADIVIAVDLNWDRMGPAARSSQAIEPADDAVPGMLATLLAKLPLGPIRSGPGAATDMPSMLDVLLTSLHIMQVRITRSRMAGDPADVVIRPRLSDVAVMDYHRAGRAIAEGERAAQQALAHLAEVIGS